MTGKLTNMITIATDEIKKRLPKDAKPLFGIILGTGLSSLSKNIEESVTIPYNEIPHFPVSTVISHQNNLTYGKIKGKEVIAMEGRFHYYEGYSLEEVTFPVRVMKALGIKVLIVSNAAGGINLGYDKGDLILIEDHINFMGLNPLIGPNDEELGDRFPDMCEPYSYNLIERAEKSAKSLGLKVKRGVYLWISGPCLETRAEYKMFRIFGADCIGMSTVPEVIVGVHSGLDILGVSIITDICIPEKLEPVDINKILETAGEAEPKLTKLITDVIAQYN